VEPRTTHARAVEPWIGTSPLRGPLLALLLRQEHPIGAYKLATLLGQRLPAWKVDASAVSHLLKRLHDEGLVSSGPTRRSKTYSATAKTRPAVEEWMKQPLEGQAVREELHARIVSSAPHHAPMLITALEKLELEAFAIVTSDQEPEQARGSWTSLTIDITRQAEDKALRAKIDWSRLARHRITEWTESQRRRGSAEPHDGSSVA